MKHKKQIASLEYITIFFVLFISFIAGCSNSQKDIDDEQSKPWFVLDQPGMWVNDPRMKGHVADKGAQSDLEKLGTLGYLSGYKSAPKQSGVTKYIKEKAFPGYNLCISGHKAEALLTDMDGKLLHKWSFDFTKLGRQEGFVSKHNANHWRAVHLFENGDLLANHDYASLIKLDKDSNLYWYYNKATHHDLDISSNGNIYILTAELKSIPEKEKPLVEDYITILDPDGNEIEKISIIECFRNSRFSRYLKMAMKNFKKNRGDIFHTNSVTIFKRSISKNGLSINKGDLLVSIRHLSALAVIDIDEKKVKHLMLGPWKYQHEPRIQENGNILIFDNSGHEGNSRIIEYNPYKDKVEWSYVGNPPESFRSDYCGFVQRLPNGNTLITETCSGRAFEVSADNNEIVWEYYNPFRAGKNNELIAALFEVYRLGSDFPLDWISQREK